VKVAGKELEEFWVASLVHGVGNPVRMFQPPAPFP
jgi:hypothetical protein